MTLQNSTKEKYVHLYSIHIPKYLQNEWKKLFTKHLYCIGKDIRHKDNLLLQYGFTKQRPPAPDKGSSQYSFTEQNDQVILWGFGMMFATKNEGLFLWRHEFEPKFLKVNSLLPNLWDPDQLPQCTMPKTQEETLLMLQLLVKSIKWLENYESWVLAKCGQSYRNESLYGKNSYDAHHIRLDEKWHELSEKFAKILKTSEPESDHES
ncbi:MAG: hypothetical protein ACPKQO_06640 [Nitrososphaeraceae archaeon]